MVEQRGFPSCRVVTVFAAQIGCNVGGVFRGQLAFADGHGAVMAGETDCGDLRMVKYRRRPRHKVGVAIRTLGATIHWNMELGRPSQHTCGQNAVMARHAIGNVRGLRVIKACGGNKLNCGVAEITRISCCQMGGLWPLQLANNGAG